MIPANDPLSLALAHENSPRRRSARSPSPFSRTQTNNGNTVTRRVIHRISGLQSPPVDIVELDEVEADMVAEQLRDIAEKSNANGNGVPSKVQVKKIDWEVPRKVLHSSIGMYRFRVSDLLVAHGSSGFFTVYLYVSQGSPDRIIMVLWAALALVIAPADLLRLNYPPFERLYERFLGFLMRDSEKVRGLNNHSAPICSSPRVFISLLHTCPFIYCD